MQIGTVGLGRMGGTMARRLMRGGHEVIAYATDPAAVKQISSEGATGVNTLDDLVARLKQPRTAWIMVPAGEATEEVVRELAKRMTKGDVIIDGGNSFYKDDVRRKKMVEPQGIHYIDAGTSGGVWGLERGYCLMIGGPRDVVERLDAIFKTLAPGMGSIARTPGREKLAGTAEQGYLYCGPSGAGHFVKMVHNGIEYGLMQSYAEGLDIFKNATSKDLEPDLHYDLDLADITEVWRRGSRMATGLRPAPPCTFVIFGAAGDLTKRKLLPALYNLKAAGLLPRRFAIVGVTRKEKTHEEFREEQTKDIHEFATQRIDETLWEELRGCLYYQAGEFTDPATYTKLEALLKEVSTTHGTGDNVLFYLATPPEFFGEIVKRLGETGLSRQGAGAWRHVVVEKPFGHDLESARALNAELSRVLEENQIFRIDHYLGKETVQNIMGFRFATGFLEPVWNRNYVDHVQITVAETVGVEDRGGYYDKAGVVRDMMQNHMLQLLAPGALEPPTSFHAEAERAERVKGVKAMRSFKPADVLKATVRGQVGPGL